jgi:hypothetical protein
VSISWYTMSATLEQHSLARDTARVAASPPLIRAGIAAFGATYLGLGIWMAVSPHTFYTALGPFDVYNSHYIRDVSTFHVALGIGFLIALRNPSWCVPMLAVAAAQFGLHSINHLVDIDTAHPAWVGYFDFFSLAAATAQLAWLLSVAGKGRRAQSPPKGAHQR